MTRITAALAQLLRDLRQRRPTTTAGILTLILLAVLRIADVTITETTASLIVGAVLAIVGSQTPRPPAPADPDTIDPPRPVRAA